MHICSFNDYQRNSVFHVWFRTRDFSTVQTAMNRMNHPFPTRVEDVLSGVSHVRTWENGVGACFRGSLNEMMTLAETLRTEMGSAISFFMHGPQETMEVFTTVLVHNGQTYTCKVAMRYPTRQFVLLEGSLASLPDLLVIRVVVPQLISEGRP